MAEIYNGREVLDKLMTEGFVGYDGGFWYCPDHCPEVVSETEYRGRTIYISAQFSNSGETFITRVHPALAGTHTSMSPKELCPAPMYPVGGRMTPLDLANHLDWQLVDCRIAIDLLNAEDDLKHWVVNNQSAVRLMVDSFGWPEPTSFFNLKRNQLCRWVELMRELEGSE